MPKASRARSSPTARTNPLAKGSHNVSKKPTSSTKAKTQPRAKTAEVSTATANNAPTVQSLDQSEANYLLLVRLTDTEDPAVTRLLSLPPSLTFAKVHEVLQAAFGWAQAHSHCFTVYSSDADSSHIGRPALTIQSSFMNEAMPDDLKGGDEALYTLANVYEKPEWNGKAKIIYEYDMGDSWEHEFALLGRTVPCMPAQVYAPDDIKILCLGGEGHGVAEDCGGFPGWADLKDEFKRKKASDQELRNWYKTTCINGDPKGLDPYKWSLLDVNDQLQTIEV